MYLELLALPCSLTTALSRRQAVLSFLVLAVLQGSTLTDAVSAGLRRKSVPPASYPGDPRGTALALLADAQPRTEEGQS